jgi:hypothetical protein
MHGWTLAIANSARHTQAKAGAPARIDLVPAEGFGAFTQRNVARIQ